MTNKLVIAFVRNPEIGKVKTRLAASIGDAAALRIYQELLAHTETVLRPLPCDKAIYYSEQIAYNDLWKENHYQKHLQTDSDLGTRMLDAFSRAFSDGYEKVVIVGSDLYDLRASHLNEAFAALDNADVVLGPAQDGGYYLLGMTALHTALFQNKSWSTATVLEETLQDLKHIPVHLLEELNDIDTFEDLDHHPDLKKMIAT